MLWDLIPFASKLMGGLGSYLNQKIAFQPDFIRTVNPFFSKLSRYVNLCKNRSAVGKGRKNHD